MDKLPLDARLLSNAVIELNIARHILSLYAKEHPLVQLSLDKTFALLAELFDLRAEITLAVAKDTLIIDGHHLDPKNPVYREFALALSRMSVALVSFVKGATREEVFDFFRFLSRETADISSATLPQIIAEYPLPHILIQPLDYRTFAFAEDAVKQDGPDVYLLERHIKALLEGGLPVEGVQTLVGQIEPAKFAALLNQSGSEDVREEAYDSVVISYLRSGSKPFSGGDLQRLMTFIAGLRPELKQQFLSSSVKALSSDPAVLERALDGVSVDSIIDFFGAIDRSGAALPEALGTLIARFSRTGIELPGGGLGVDDVLFSREVAGLFKEDAHHQHGPQTYQGEIRRIVESREAAPGGPDGAEIAGEMEEDYIRYCHANALLALLDQPLPQLISLEDEDGYARIFNAHAARSMKTGQYAQLLELLTRFDDLGGRGRQQAVVEAVREYCRSAEFVAGVAESFRRYGRADRAGAALVCAYYGETIVPLLFDLLAVEERMYVRKLLLQLLIGLGKHVAREAPVRLLDKRWHVRRNTLYVLAESGARCDPGLLVRLGGDEDARVRLECARCLVRTGNGSGVNILRSLLNEATGGSADAAIAAAGALGVRELLPDLVALVRHPSGDTGLARRLRIVRTIAQIAGAPAAAALQDLLLLRVSLFPSESKRFRAEVRKALLRVSGKLQAAAADAKAEETP